MSALSFTQVPTMASATVSAMPSTSGVMACNLTQPQ
jgi:hypothetical protein